MNKIIFVGNDAGLADRISRISREQTMPNEAIRVEVVDSDRPFDPRGKRPGAVILDVRSPTATTLAVFSTLNARRRQVPLMLQLTPGQIAQKSWQDFFSAKEAARPFTEQTTDSDLQSLLLWLLTQKHSRRTRVPAQAAPQAMIETRFSENEDWQAQNHRRIDLIYKRQGHPLTLEEQEELSRLQAIARRHVKQTHPLPFESLNAWEAEAHSATKSQ